MNEERKVMLIIVLVAFIAVLATLMVAVLAITDAEAADCLPGTTRHAYGPADAELVYLEQPVGEPHWQYVGLLAPDGNAWSHPIPPGQYRSTTPGQWHVCFTQDLWGWLDTLGLGTTTTIAVPVAETVTCHDDAGEPGILQPDGTCWTEALYNDTFSDENLATVPSQTNPGRSVADGLLSASPGPAAERPRYFAGVELPSFARIIAIHHAAL